MDSGQVGSLKLEISDAPPKGFWGLVDGTDQLADGASDAATRECRQKAQEAFSTMIMAIGIPQLYLVTSCEQPMEVWDNLCSHFECETLTNKLFNIFGRK